MADTFIWVFRWLFWIFIVTKENVGNTDLSGQRIFFLSPFIAIGWTMFIFLLLLFLSFGSMDISSILVISLLFTGIYLLTGIILYFVDEEFHSENSRHKKWQYRGPW